jgi:tetratricopeptide (TPR) repeat protein
MGRLRLGNQDWRRIDGWLARARLAWLRGEDVLEYTRRSVDAARSQGFDDRLARALHLQGRVALEAGDLNQAESCLAEAETLTRGTVNDVGALAEVLRDQAEVHTQRGDYKKALRLLREARDRFVLADRKDGVAACSRAQSRIMAGQGKLDEARGLLRYAIEQVQEGGDLRASADLNAEAGMLAEQQNRPREALEHFSSALEQLRVVATDRRRLADIEARVNTLSQSLALPQDSLPEESLPE